MFEDVVYKFITLTKEKSSNELLLNTCDKLEQVESFIEQQKTDEALVSRFNNFFHKEIIKHIEFISLINSYKDEFNIDLETYDNITEDAFKSLSDLIDAFQDKSIEDTKLLRHYVNLREKYQDIVSEESVQKKRQEAREAYEETQIKVYGTSFFLIGFLGELRFKNKKLLRKLYAKFAPKLANKKLDKMRNLMMLSEGIIIKYREKYPEDKTFDNLHIIFEEELNDKYLSEKFRKEREKFLDEANSLELEAIQEQLASSIDKEKGETENVTKENS